MREFSQGGGPAPRNSYVTERSVPYARDYGGNISHFILIFLLTCYSLLEKCDSSSMAKIFRWIKLKEYIKG